MNKKYFVIVSVCLGVLLSGCSNDVRYQHRMSSNMKGCATSIGCTQVPAVRIPAIIIPSGVACGSTGNCRTPVRASTSEYDAPESRLNMRDSIYPKTYDTYCSPKM